jgi:Protein of unknown function (DUF2630)
LSSALGAAMMPAMEDVDIFKHVNALYDEEERLYRLAGDGQGLGLEDSDRLEAIKVELDRCYDLLHQRVARRDAGQDPGDAELRPADVVEHYQQ